ncbi:terminase [Phaeobacter inhibens]|uniref:terminase n=1 Tax=Phaeobacter inhibens TaxID=221822 RepID=UPI000C9C7F80|nr:terminase [Phaeobacter inhibens]AUQ64427.1 Phage terminase large subunit [Phaeobacter inhibens]
MAAEVREQFADPRWRLSNLYYIIDKRGHQVKFTPNTQQLDFMETLHGRDLILKARQLGFTTFAGIISLDEAYWNPNWAAAIIAHTKPDAQKILKTKVRYPYDQLPDGLKAANPLVNDAADTLALANNSSVVVTNSARGGTLNRLHVSEFGKICARFPDKAKEIVSGSFPAAENGSITIESTAEGQQGEFFDMVQKAKEKGGRELSPREYRLHFYPWWQNPEYTVPEEWATISDEDARYFSELEHSQGIALTAGQKAWWVLQEETLGGTMKREYPATPEEAFEQALEGAYFANQFASAHKLQRIGDFPYDPRYEVNTFWDLGRNDMNSIWLHQDVNGRDRFVGYYENSGEYIAHYLKWLKDWARNRGASWGDHYWPHDGDRQDLFLENGRLQEVQKMGFRPRTVPRISNKLEAIEAARSAFPNCDFDKAGTDIGLKRLKHYRKEWDARHGVWKDRPLHDENSNGADAFMTFATGYSRPKPQSKGPLRRNMKGIA